MSEVCTQGGLNTTALKQLKHIKMNTPPLGVISCGVQIVVYSDDCMHVLAN